MERSDIEWIRLLKSDNKEVQDELWSQLYGFATIIAGWYGQDGQVVLDAAESAYHLIIRRGIYQYNFRAPFIRGFCRRVVTREMLRCMKREQIRARREVEFPLDILASPSTPEEATILQRLSPCLEQLASRDRQILLLLDLHGYAPQEVADHLGITRNHTNVIAHRARRQMQMCLRGQGLLTSDDVLHL